MMKEKKKELIEKLEKGLSPQDEDIVSLYEKSGREYKGRCRGTTGAVGLPLFYSSSLMDTLRVKKNKKIKRESNNSYIKLLE